MNATQTKSPYPIYNFAFSDTFEIWITTTGGGTMELRHLRYFVTVAEELHFGNAARRLNIAQPPLSQQIRQLERELGVSLLDRTKRGVQLTDAGKVFLEKSREILAEVERARETARQVSRGEAGRIIIGFTGSTMYDLLPLLHSYRDKYPLVDVVLRRMGSTEQAESLHKGAIHVGLLCTPVDSNSLNFIPIRQQRLMAVLPQSHPLASRQSPIAVHELKEDAFIISPREAGSSYHDVVLNTCHQAGFVPKIAMEAYEFETIVALVSIGVGVALLPHSFQEFQVQGVVYKELEESYCMLETSVAWRRDEKSCVVKRFIDMVRSMVVH
jgi:DNA-binding transcriptional LysR family regulator